RGLAAACPPVVGRVGGGGQELTATFEPFPTGLAPDRPDPVQGKRPSRHRLGLECLGVPTVRHLSQAVQVSLEVDVCPDMEQTAGGRDEADRPPGIGPACRREAGKVNLHGRLVLPRETGELLAVSIWRRVAARFRGDLLFGTADLLGEDAVPLVSEDEPCLAGLGGVLLARPDTEADRHGPALWRELGDV